MQSPHEYKAEFMAYLERHLAETGTAPSGFGRRAMGDGNFVYDLRAGQRSPNLDTLQQAYDFILGVE